jgi:hypothetical protein
MSRKRRLSYVSQPDSDETPRDATLSASPTQLESSKMSWLNLLCQWVVVHLEKVNGPPVTVQNLTRLTSYIFLRNNPISPSQLRHLVINVGSGHPSLVPYKTSVIFLS